MLDQIIQNESDSIEIDVLYNNELTTPDSISITSITDPTGAVRLTNQAVTAGSTTGRYSFTVPDSITDTLGTYTAIWEFAIGDGTYQQAQEFQVVTSLEQSYILPTQLRDKSTYDRITSTSPPDAVLQQYINQATYAIDAYIGGNIWHQTYEEDIRCVPDTKTGGLHIPVSHRPIDSVTSMSVKTDYNTDVDVDTDYIRVNKDLGYLAIFGKRTTTLNVCFSRDWTSGDIIPVATVKYSAGYESLPDDFVYAVVKYSEYLFKKDMGEDVPTRSEEIGPKSESYHHTVRQDSMRDSLGLSDMGMIKKILDQYKQPLQAPGIGGPIG